MLKRHSPATVHAPASPYSHGVEVPPNARLLYVSGQIGQRPDGTTPADLAGQNEQAWANLKAVLAAAGMGVADIVRLNAYVVGAEGIAAFREVRNRMVGDLKPASTLIVVAGLASPAWKVEIECVAAKA
jgi:2-iminobutanoate/2-iminopropanoate deaminase